MGTFIVSLPCLPEHWHQIRPLSMAYTAQHNLVFICLSGLFFIVHSILPVTLWSRNERQFTDEIWEIQEGEVTGPRSTASDGRTGINTCLVDTKATLSIGPWSTDSPGSKLEPWQQPMAPCSYISKDQTWVDLGRVEWLHIGAQLEKMKKRREERERKGREGKTRWNSRRYDQHLKQNHKT